MITTLWGTLGILVACIALLFLGVFCAVQTVRGINLFIRRKEPMFLVATVIYFTCVAIVVWLFLEILF